MKKQEHISYSAADIARYYNGGMTAAEMHALEKEALDDPFLADALEGYRTAGVGLPEDILLLEKKLDERIHKKDEQKVIPLQVSKRAWLRVAALLIIIAGAGLLAYQFVLKEKTSSVAGTENNSIPKVSESAADTQHLAPDVVKSDTTRSQKTQIPATGKSTRQQNRVSDEKEENPLVSKDSALPGAANTPTQPAPVVSAAAKKKDEKKEFVHPGALKQLNEIADPRENARKDINKQAVGATDHNDRNEPLGAKQDELKREAHVARNFSSQNNKTNIFRGQVTDFNNNPLPFANVTNIQDNVGTYTDAKGNFVLVSPDSVLNVQVRSVGYESHIAQLKNNTSRDTVALQQDTKNITSTVISNRKINTERKRENNTMVLEEPEPSDGWYNFDTYLANNITIPDEIKTRKTQTGEVELSFSIDDNGDPVNITVEKSVCQQCDAEAIRLLKDGPKWKKKRKNARAKIAVAF